MSAPTVSNTTIEYFDGFDDYNTAQMLRYMTFASSNMSIGPGNGRNGTGALQTTNSSGNTYATFTFTSQATRTIGFAYKAGFIGTSTNGNAVAAFLDGASEQCDLRLNADGTLSFVRAGTTVLGSSASPVISAGVWAYIEVSLTVNSSTGAYTVRVNGTPVISGSNVNTRNTANSTWNGVALGTFVSGNNSLVFYFDDFYSRADGIFCGDCRVETKLPNANGAINNFTPLAATNFTEVADSPADDDTSYNVSSTVGDIDLFAYPALVTTAGNVQAIMTVPVLRNDAAGTVTAVSQYRQAGNNYSGGPQNIGSTTYNAYPDIQGQDPSTGAVWTIAGVNSAQFGVKRTA